MGENQGSTDITKAQLLFNSVKEVERAVNTLEDFADLVKGEGRPSDQSKIAEEHPTLTSVLTNAHNELDKLTERIHAIIADLKKSLI